jgi:hypothetical protein
MPDRPEFPPKDGRWIIGDRKGNYVKPKTVKSAAPVTSEPQTQLPSLLRMATPRKLPHPPPPPSLRPRRRTPSPPFPLFRLYQTPQSPHAAKSRIAPVPARRHQSRRLPLQSRSLGLHPLPMIPPSQLHLHVQHQSHGLILFVPRMPPMSRALLPLRIRKPWLCKRASLLQTS